MTRKEGYDKICRINGHSRARSSREYKDVVPTRQPTIGKEYQSLLVFLLLSFFLPFAAVVFQGMISNPPVRLILSGVQAASPTVSALVVLCLNRNVKGRLSRLLRREHLPLAILLPALTACATMLLAKLIYCGISGTTFVWGPISPVGFLIILWALVAEELGWRGYLEPLLLTSHVPRWLAPGVVGVIWCLWHYHFFLQRGMEVPIPLFLVSCVIESYLYSFFLEVTGHNLISAMTYHFAWNLFYHLAAIAPSQNGGSLVPYILLVVLEALALPALFRIKPPDVDPKTPRGEGVV